MLTSPTVDEKPRKTAGVEREQVAQGQVELSSECWLSQCRPTALAPEGCKCALKHDHTDSGASYASSEARNGSWRPVPASQLAQEGEFTLTQAGWCRGWEQVWEGVTEGEFLGVGRGRQIEGGRQVAAWAKS